MDLETRNLRAMRYSRRVARRREQKMLAYTQRLLTVSAAVFAAALISLFITY